MQKIGEKLMRAIARTIDGKNSPFIVDMPIPKVEPNHVIVKIMASPINVSDEYYCNGGKYGVVPTEPYACGFEGAGIVTEVGEGVPHEMIGKKVSAWSDVGTSTVHTNPWAQYARIPYDACVQLDDAASCEELCGLFVNGLTLLGFVRIAKEMKLKALVHTAALSSLGRSLLKVCKAEGIELIGVVRKSADLKRLIDMGAKYAFDLTSPTFVTDLNKACKTLDARVAFDAIGGSMTGELIKAMPENSSIYTYGMLSGSWLDTNGFEADMAKKNIKVEGFMVVQDKIMKDAAEKKMALDYIRNDLKTGGHLFKINVVKKFKLDEFKKALETYRTVASQGKVIFVPN